MDTKWSVHLFWQKGAVFCISFSQNNHHHKMRGEKYNAEDKEKVVYIN